jgi:hypothetical protein
VKMNVWVKNYAACYGMSNLLSSINHSVAVHWQSQPSVDDAFQRAQVVFIVRMLQEHAETILQWGVSQKLQK